MEKRYGLYVPAPGGGHGLEPGSAIIGEPKDEYMHTHYEGGTYDNVKTYEDRIQVAAGRRAQQYPTSAQRAWRREDVIHVGDVRYREELRLWVIDRIVDSEALEQWSPGPHHEGGSPEAVAQAAFRRWRDLAPMEQLRIHMKQAQGGDIVQEIVASLKLSLQS